MVIYKQIKDGNFYIQVAENHKKYLSGKEIVDYLSKKSTVVIEDTEGGYEIDYDELIDLRNSINQFSSPEEIEVIIELMRELISDHL